MVAVSAVITCFAVILNTSTNLGAETRAAAAVPVDPAVLAAVQSGASTDVLVLFGPTPDLAPARAWRDKARRGRWVYDTLRRSAERAQAPLIARFEAAGVPYQRFWAVNAVRARLDARWLDEVRRLPGVTQILANRPHRGIDAIPPGEDPDENPVPEPPRSIISGIEWGVTRVNAPWAWSQGYRGQGVVIAGQDTGYDWDHPALIRAYRGYDPVTGLADHDFNWHDSIHADIGTPNGNPCGYDAAAPCDDHNHGTHTMGTLAGNDLAPSDPNWPAGAPNAVGIAPGAKWIGCRNMDNGDGIPSTYIECFEWFVAPYPIGGDPFEDGDPAQAPDLINNSWGCPPSEGCQGPEIEPALDAADAAGILVVVSAGNAGSACGTVVDPPAVYPRALSVGATDASDLLAGFSSRGPATYQGQTLAKPEISAPGVSVRSSIRGTGYASFQGTSMAGPHVGGAAALLLSAAPALKGQTDLVKAILTRTADARLDPACGGAPGGRPNHRYGWGIVNARHAIESIALPATLSGTVRGAGSGAPLANVTIKVHTGDPDNPAATTTTGASGSFSVTLPTGAYQVQASHPAATTAAVGPVYLVGGLATGQDIALATARPGDCNNDLALDAGDLSALGLELFDADGSAPAAAPGASYPGSPIGCNPNGDTAVDAADLSCAVLAIFGGPGACGSNGGSP